MGIEKAIGNYDDVRSLGSRFRRRRFAPLLKTIERISAAKGSVSILDIGGMENYWNIVPIEDLVRLRVHVTLLNLPGEAAAPTRPDVFTTVEGDGCALPFADGSFDIAHSNSVIEHVFGWGAKKAYAREAMRMSDVWFHQTPNFWFPWEPHFGLPIFHWLPDAVRIAITLRRPLGWTARSTDVDEAMAVVEFATLLTQGQFSHLFPGSTLTTERLLGLPKSFVVTKGVDPI